MFLCVSVIDIVTVKFVCVCVCVCLLYLYAAGHKLEELVIRVELYVQVVKEGCVTSTAIEHCRQARAVMALLCCLW